MKKENLGVTLALTYAALDGAFPVILNKNGAAIPPILFAGLTILLGSMVAFVYAATTHTLHTLRDRRGWFPMVMVALCVSVLPMLLLFIGTRETSGTNTSFLLLSELIFTLLFTPFFGEKNDLNKITGVIGILIGAIFLLFNGNVKINNGDILIILSTITYPVGNFYAKKAFNYIAPGAVLFIRFLLAGLLLCILSLLLEPFRISPIYNNLEYILLFGLVFMGATKIVWYEGFKYLDISKSISLLMTFPLFSLVTIFFIGDETISTYQWIGIIIMMVGVYFSIKRKSVDPALTKYAA